MIIHTQTEYDFTIEDEMERLDFKCLCFHLERLAGDQFGFDVTSKINGQFTVKISEVSGP